jgi:hypothetical protein
MPRTTNNGIGSYRRCCTGGGGRHCCSTETHSNNKTETNACACGYCVKCRYERNIMSYRVDLNKFTKRFKYNILLNYTAYDNNIVI